MKTTTLHQARLGFKLRNQTENKSPHTIIWYDQHVERLETFLQRAHVDNGALYDPPLGEITTDQLRAFIAFLQGKQMVYENHPFREPTARALSPASIRGIVATLNAFFTWSENEELIARSPMSKINKPKVPRKIKERFSDDDIAKLYEACKQYDDSLAVRNDAIVRFLLDTGVRANELCSLTMDHLDMEHGRARIFGKGAKERYVYFGKKTRAALWKYTVVHRAPSHHPNVFVTHSGEPIRANRLSAMLNDLGARAGVPHTHPHRFRHTAARLLARNGFDAFMIQAILGHEGLETTRIYVELEREDLERAYERASPVDRLK